DCSGIGSGDRVDPDRSSERVAAPMRVPAAPGQSRVLQRAPPWRPLRKALLPDSEPVDQLAVTAGILGLQVIEQAAPLADQLQEPAAGMVVLLVRLEVLGQVM